MEVSASVTNNNRARKWGSENMVPLNDPLFLTELSMWVHLIFSPSLPVLHTQQCLQLSPQSASVV